MTNRFSKSTPTAWCLKILIIFGVCCIIGWYLIPFVVYYISKTRDNAEINDDYSHEKNLLRLNITLMETCNFSDLTCVDQLLYTHEALRTINLPLSQQCCIRSNRVETLFCDALMECSNESYVKDIVCQQVRQEYCTAEWRMLEVQTLLISQTDGLIVCDEYEETAPLNCSNHFGLADDETACLLMCEEFSTTPNVVLYPISSLISIIGGLFVIVISLKKRKKMFIFPQILIVINAGIIVILQTLLFIPAVSIGRWNILCSSKFLFDALDNPTAFCTFQGTVILSGMVLFSYYWNLYVVHLALKLFYPMKSDKLFKSDHRRKIFFAEVFIVFLIGTIPAILIATVGPNYKIASFPPIYCSIDGIYFLAVSMIPNLITGFLSHILILVILYKLHIHGGIFKSKQGTVGKKVCTCQFTVPELKVVFVLAYFLLFTIILWTSFSNSGGSYYTNIRRYADCMAGGNRKDHDCQELREDIEVQPNRVLEVINLLFLAFLNFASLPFVIQFQTIKNSIRQARQKLCCKCK